MLRVLAIVLALGACIDHFTFGGRYANAAVNLVRAILPRLQLPPLVAQKEYRRTLHSSQAVYPAALETDAEAGGRRINPRHEHHPVAERRQDWPPAALAF